MGNKYQPAAVVTTSTTEHTTELADAGPVSSAHIAENDITPNHSADPNCNVDVTSNTASPDVSRASATPDRTTCNRPQVAHPSPVPNVSSDPTRPVHVQESSLAPDNSRQNYRASPTHIVSNDGMNHDTGEPASDATAATPSQLVEPAASTHAIPFREITVHVKETVDQVIVATPQTGNWEQSVSTPAQDNHIAHTTPSTCNMSVLDSLSVPVRNESQQQLKQQERTPRSSFLAHSSQ